jgi:hypothetical protein
MKYSAVWRIGRLGSFEKPGLHAGVDRSAAGRVYRTLELSTWALLWRIGAV